MHDDWFDAATAGNTEYLEENIETLGGSTTETGCSGLIRAIYAHKLASVEVLAAREYKIPDISNKYPIEIALKLYYYEACFILLMLHPDEAFEKEVKDLKSLHESDSITRKELNDKLAELTNRFVTEIRDGTLSLSPWHVSRLSSVASCEVLLTPEDQSMQNAPLDNADDDTDAAKEKEESNKQEEDSNKTEDTDKEDHETRERRSLVDRNDDGDSSDDDKGANSAAPAAKKGCCQCM